MRASWAVAIGLVACNPGKKIVTDENSTVVASFSASGPNADLDVLFLVDDSPSMQDKQDNLRLNFPNFVNVLASRPGGLPNLHLGVVTSDVGTATANGTAPAIGGGGTGSCSNNGKNGALVKGMAGAQITGNFISDIQPPGNPLPPRQSNYDRNSTDLASVFGQMVNVGANGCGFEQSLEAVKRALNPQNAANQGFLRTNAALAIIFLTDEDDCSAKDPALFSPSGEPLTSFRCTQHGVKCLDGGATEADMGTVGAKSGCSSLESSTLVNPVQPYVDFIKGLKASPEQIMVATIAGDRTPVQVEMRAPPGGGTPVTALAHSCTYQGALGPEVADPAVRVGTFAKSFALNYDSSICETNLSDALEGAAGVINGSSCVNQPLPDDLNKCVLEDVLGEMVTTISFCGSAPCYRFEPDNKCGGGQHIVVDRGGTVPPAGTVTRMRCTYPPEM